MGSRTATAIAYTPIPPEPWGRRLARVREDVYGYTLDEAASLAGYYMPTTGSTISRLEGLREEPRGPKSQSRRLLAYVLCHAYQVDPAEFGLSSDDAPPGMRLDRRSTASSTKW